MQKKNIALIGNPNCGKTTLFNSYTGKKLKVANYPGVTVERKEGEFIFNDTEIKLIDLPGVYSLNSYSTEEIITKEFIENGDIDVIIDVIDASSLERNLYLALQLIESGISIVIALNMMDIVKQRGIKINIPCLEKRLGVKIIPISAKKKEGLDKLIKIAIDEKSRGKHLDIQIDTENEIIQKYDYIEYLLDECLEDKKKIEAITEKIDKILTNKYLGLPIFIIIMGLVFILVFTIGDIIKKYFEILLDIIINSSTQLLDYFETGPAIKSLIVDGIITGVGEILTFIPNIFILFTCLAFLEDTGYMARVAYVMSGIMGKIGLSGKACIPMILGFGCSVPAVMATRTLESKKDKLRTISLIPCISCSAKIPIYVLFSDIFFGKYAVLASLSMYINGIIIAIIIGIIRNKGDNHKEELIIELPEYKVPDINSIKLYVLDKINEYMKKAGTTILMASVILWGILNIGKNGFVINTEESIGAFIGKAIVPILKPAGLGYWQIAVALIAGLAAKEVVISSIYVLFGINMATGNMKLLEVLKSQGFETINAYCLMIFCLLYIPCIATIATIKEETKSIKFTLNLVLFQLLLAWGVSTVVYHLKYFFI